MRAPQRHDDKFGVIVDAERKDAVSEAAAYVHGHGLFAFTEGVLAGVKFREEGKVRGDEAASAGDDDLPAVDMAGKCDVRPQAEIPAMVFRLVRKADCEAGIRRRAVGRQLVRLQLVSRIREVTVRDADQRQGAERHLFIIHQDDAERLDVVKKTCQTLSRKPVLMIPGDIVDRGNLNGAFEETERKAVVGVVFVDNIPGYDDDVGAEFLYPVDEQLLLGPVELIMKVGDLHDAEAVQLRGNIRAGVFIFAHRDVQVLVKAYAREKKRHNKGNRNRHGEFLLPHLVPEDKHGKAAPDGAAEYRDRNQFSLRNAPPAVARRALFVNAEQHERVHAHSEPIEKKQHGVIPFQSI